MIAKFIAPNLLSILLFVGATARADEHQRPQQRCMVTLAETVHTGWEDAVEDARAAHSKLADGDNNNGDCSDIVVTPDIAGATVTFTTRDGRRVDRRVNRPSDLRPLIDALDVAVPGGATAPVTTMTTVSSPTIGGGGNSSSQPDQTNGVSSNKPQALVFASGGMRGGEGAGTFAPSAQLAVGVALARWELGVAGRWETERTISTSPERHVEQSAVGVGAVVGRRDPMGPVLFVSGLSFGGYASKEESRRPLVSTTAGAVGVVDRHNRVTVADDFFEPRAGLFAGIVAPRTSRVRIRSQLGSELALTSHKPNADELVPAPRWSIALMVGIETGFLP